ncbi:hypothetical protein BBK36DRAFT_1114330 [Trichoderma citrinoviride]|uniref:Uncharacterized protein n=1 Tax=Trichoderma citrinoviride TaxID=58853 RepID=A0A2T4BEW9_9HYPO|nr:hypothetical protein BBK36DRAFT_1114330 [Trichoderma citrinoviride]PTB67880.1 hypothetical protein BBK36DRAFT_1114330 [Trichoderma citrinoviride]
MSATLCLTTLQALQHIEKLRGYVNYDSWRLLIMANARALGLASHLDGSARKSSLIPRAKEAHATAESCARVLILGSIAPNLLPVLLERGLQDNTSAADLMMWLHSTVSPREATEAAHNDLAKLMRIKRKDFPSMEAYSKEALNLWARISDCWPSSAMVIAAMSILEGMRSYNENAYLGWKHFVIDKKGMLSQQNLLDLAMALRDHQEDRHTSSSIRVMDMIVEEEEKSDHSGTER